ncbi:hypothetical protein GCM10011578_050620 [Streptomyces fuscichromogenes]|uniref:Uncharacterized protein n=1 Tax=Streptomyces fuscichromogenes TaxID=1324013 RepID=A0A917XFF3_9ACTN|nr:hypothetical protein GCM10011578_050620 [Streptomyces fuscichromogenes]
MGATQAAVDTGRLVTEGVSLLGSRGASKSDLQKASALVQGRLDRLHKGRVTG